MGMCARLNWHRICIDDATTQCVCRCVCIIDLRPQRQMQEVRVTCVWSWLNSVAPAMDNIHIGRCGLRLQTLYGTRCMQIACDYRCVDYSWPLDHKCISTHIPLTLRATDVLVRTPYRQSALHQMGSRNYTHPLGAHIYAHIYRDG